MSIRRITLARATVAPMPTPRVATVVSVKSGARSVRRTAYATSARSAPSASRHCDRRCARCSVWRSARRAASAIGETVTLDGRSYAIIGVMPRLFDPSVFALIPRAELWLPHLPARSDNYLAALGVLRPGATLAQVTRDVAAAKARLGERDPMRSLVPMIDPLLDRAGSETRRVLQLSLIHISEPTRPY